MNNGLGKTLFYAFLVTFPFGLLVRFRIATNIYITPQDIIVFLIFIATTLQVVKKRKLISSDKFILFQILFLATGGVSLIVNSFVHNEINLAVSSLYITRYISYLSLLNIGNLFSKTGDERKTLVFIGLIFLAFGYLQYFFYYDLKYLYYLGWDNHLYRLFSTFMDPNFAGVFYSLFFIFIFFTVLQFKIARSYRELVLSFFTIIALYLTYSRTALITLLTGVISIAILKGRLWILLLVLVAFSILLATLSDTSVEGLNPFRTASSIERVISLKEGWQIFTDNPLIGTGFNAYRYALLRHGFRNPTGASLSNADAGTDNSLLFVLSTSGVIGFTFFALSYFFLLKKLYIERTKISVIPLCMIISFLAASLFLNVLFYTPILTFVFVIIALRKRIFLKS